MCGNISPVQWNLQIKDMLGQGVLSFIERCPLFGRLKCTGIIGIGTSIFVLYRDVSFIQSVLYQRFHCIPTSQNSTVVVYRCSQNKTKEH